MNQNYNLLILSALSHKSHNIKSLMILLNLDNSNLQEFSKIIANLAQDNWISYFDNKLCLTQRGALPQKVLFSEWKQTNDLLFNILKGANNE